MRKRTVLRRIHPVAGVLAWCVVLLFWVSTVAVELFGSADAVRTVKLAIPWGLLVLVPALAVTGASGFALGGASRNPLVLAKKRRMPFVAAVGVLVLVPCALYLAVLAGRGDLGTTFYLVQAVELLAGAVNIALLGLSVRDGLRLRRRRVARPAEPARQATGSRR